MLVTGKDDELKIASLLAAVVRIVESAKEQEVPYIEFILPPRYERHIEEEVIRLLKANIGACFVGRRDQDTLWCGDLQMLKICDVFRIKFK